MIWHFYSWTFQLKSPLHIGYHKIMHLFRTRPYVPGRLLWGALTSKLTPILELDSYQKIGNFLKKTMRFGYLYIYADNQLFLPFYSESGLKFGNLSKNEFDKRFISSIASAPIDSESLTAEEGMLHEVEFINRYTIDSGNPVFLKGVFWVREYQDGNLSITKEGDSLFVRYNSTKIDLDMLANSFQVGGERKYGFGLLELKKPDESKEKELKNFPGEWSEKAAELYLKLKKNDPVWSHVLYTNNIDIKGNIEPLVGRDWDTKKGPGKQLNTFGLFWSPGSILNEDKIFKIDESGLWEAI
ncbi:MAG: RAMP superfamily CRISPR-associated protein [Candidatus Freyarchaeum deiterrae]